MPDADPLPTCDIDLNGPSITCRLCGLTSWHPEDVRQRYCGRCHRFHDDPLPPPPDATPPTNQHAPTRTHTH